MKPIRLQWEDVIQFEEVKGYGQHIWRDGNHLYYFDEEGGIVPQRVVYEFPLELFQLLKSGEKTLKEIHFKQFPEALRGNPKAQGLFTNSELEEILPEGAKILASKD